MPIVIYVAPSGARAASAGFVILIAADVAAMAPGTATGAAHPVMADGRDLDKTMAEKVVNDAAAFLRSHASSRGRDAQIAESAIRESNSFTEREALDKHLIEIIAHDESDLLAQLEGRTITRVDGSKMVLHVAGGSSGRDHSFDEAAIADGACGPADCVYSFCARRAVCLLRVSTSGRDSPGSGRNNFGRARAVWLSHAAD